MAKITDRTSGQYASQKGSQGLYIPSSKASVGSNVGLSYAGGMGIPEAAWTLSPMFFMGMTNYDPNYGQPGATVQAVADGAQNIAKEAGVDSTPTGSSVGGTAAY
jgi:hypothetical protein